MKEIKEVANKCLNCKTKPCSIKGCPMETNIPDVIDAIKKDDYKKAYDILIENNIFSHVCSLICPQEEQCESKCVRGIQSNPITIGKLEKFINEWAKKNNYKAEIKQKEKNGKKVAIIGSGPAGLECAIELLINGFEVDIYEKDAIPGGILVYGIPDFRLPKAIVEDIVVIIKNLGANIITNTQVGEEILISSLIENYDAVFIGIGAQTSVTYSLTEQEVKNIYTSDLFLKAYNEGNYIKDLGTVAVIGGGNVAMDCARTAVKMGADSVNILYRRDEAHMPARKIELEDAISDGVNFKELIRVDSANIKEGKIDSLNCIKTEIVDGKAVDTVDGQVFKEKANTVVFAIGLKPDKKLMQSVGITLNDWGYIDVDEDGKTNIDKIYAGGDITESKSTVCRALAAGKRAAKGIIKNLSK